MDEQLTITLAPYALKRVAEFDEAREAYFGADLDALPLAEFDELRRAYFEAAAALAYHVEFEVSVARQLAGR